MGGSFLKTFILIATAFVMAVLCILPASREFFPFWIIARGSFVMDTLFHELGHSIFGWLFGDMNIPMIFTIFQSDKMGGMAMGIGHSIIVQIGAVIGLGYLCYLLRYGALFIPCIIFTVIIAIISATGYGGLVTDYMGHGGAIAMGGFFLFRAFANLAPRGKAERWLNAYFGAFLTLGNIHFCYRLMTDQIYRMEYLSSVEFIGHHDLVKVANQLSVTIDAVAIFTIIFAVLMIFGAMLAAPFYTK